MRKTTPFDAVIKEARKDNFGAFGRGGYWKAQKVGEAEFQRIIGARTSNGKAYARFLADGKEHEIQGMSALM